MKCRLGEVRENCRSISQLVVKAAGLGCEAVIFPETADTGYDAAVIQRCSFDAQGESLRILQRGAKENRIYVLCGVVERTKRRIYNTLAVFGPDGQLLARYRKTHLITPPPFNEAQCFSSGNKLVAVDIGDMRWGLAICYDLRFPELFRRLALTGAQVLVVCAAWPSFRQTHWDILTRARAVENQAYLLAVDRVGTDGAVTFAGKSRIVTPSGEIVAEGSRHAEELIVGEIGPTAVQEFRKNLPVFDARRADLYGNLAPKRVRRYRPKCIRLNRQTNV